MHIGLPDFSTLAILSLLVVLLGPLSGTYSGRGKDAIAVIIIILTVIAVILDIVFLALKLFH